MRCYVGLGSNIGNRKQMLDKACFALAQHEHIQLIALSSLYETPALLPQNAPDDWNIAFYNQVIAINTTLSPQALLDELKACEILLGRIDRGHWAPREIDCDLLLYGAEIIETDSLIVPHPRMHERGFVLAPLNEIAPAFIHPKLAQTIAQLWNNADNSTVTRLIPKRPKIMGIVNITPDSFSDGGLYNQTNSAIKRIEELIEQGADIIDIGAESTRKNAVALSDEEEWARLYPLLQQINSHYSTRHFHISVDTYHASTIEKLADFSIDMINDVSGARAPNMFEAISRHKCNVVLMHSLSIPADSSVLMPEEIEPHLEIIRWAQHTIKRAESYGIAPDRLILDPGIGFGKTAKQSLALIEHADEIVACVPDIRWLFGHSRKSFMECFQAQKWDERDIITQQISQMLAYAQVDILRVHEVKSHIALMETLCR